MTDSRSVRVHFFHSPLTRVICHRHESGEGDDSFWMDAERRSFASHESHESAEGEDSFWMDAERHEDENAEGDDSFWMDAERREWRR